MAANISGGRDEMGWSVFRRSFNDRMDTSNDLISASIAACRDSLEFAWVGFIKTEMVLQFCWIVGIWQGAEGWAILHGQCLLLLCRFFRL